MSEKTEQPSARRLREARQKGNVARSGSLAAAGAVMGGLAALASSVPAAASELLAFTRQALTEAGYGSTPIALALDRAWHLAFALCLPVMAGVLLGAVAGAGLQVGVLFNVGAIGFQPERLSLSNGLQRLFSKKKVLEVLKATLVAGIVLGLAGKAAREAAPLAGRLPLSSPVLCMNTAFQIVRSLAFQVIVFAAAFGFLDYLLERRFRHKGLMMSREELKQEHKQAEGDPQHKAKRKQLHRALLNGSVARGVQKATVVVLNPTHVAVALRYAPQEAAAPTIVAKGVEDEAAKIRFLARQFKVPMVRDVPLARTLVRYDLGEEVPEELYLAAAAVLNKVFEMGAAVPASNPADSNSIPRSSP
ncbi:MAG: EscU/YscU/HrcU family type III secretion system export apparatus switch protein [Deltaproteobacteria bacterium]|nr:EscU/YscU/HrcU family type III secretion system export apparatus switch protein [Deltaproteobacteria bacterium]